MLKLKGWQLLVVQAVAVFCSYLMLSVVITSALEVKIFTSGGQEVSASMPKFSDLIQKEITYPYEQNYQYLQVRLSSKLPSNIIKKVYLFRCKGFDPGQCITNGIVPDIAANTGSSTLVFNNKYKWDEVSSGSVGNFLMLVKLDISGKEVWSASWDKVTKTGIRTFTPPMPTKPRGWTFTSSRA